MAAAPVEPFTGVEDAWFWVMATFAARAGGRFSPRAAGTPRPCDPDDIVKALDRLYRQRRIDRRDARVLRRYGERGFAPVADHPAEASDCADWRRVMGLLERALLERGIIRSPQPTREQVT